MDKKKLLPPKQKALKRLTKAMQQLDKFAALQPYLSDSDMEWLEKKAKPLLQAFNEKHKDFKLS